MITTGRLERARLDTNLCTTLGPSPFASLFRPFAPDCAAQSSELP